MDFNQLATDLGQFGNVEFCNYNGDDTNSVVICISGFENNISNINEYNSVIENQLSSDFSVIDAFSVQETILKAHYKK